MKRQTTTDSIKLECSSVEGQTLEHFSKPIGDCLYIDGVLERQKVTCLLDTGSQVSTLPYELFQKYFQSNICESNLTHPYIRLVAANGL